MDHRNHDPGKARASPDSSQSQRLRGFRRPPVRAVTMTVQTGSLVRLNTPDNPRLHGALARVVEMTAYGARVATAAAGTGEFRAYPEEMEPADFNPPTEREEAEVPGNPDVSPPDLAGPPKVAGGMSAQMMTSSPAITYPPPTAVREQARRHRQPSRETDIMSPTGNVCATCGSCRMVRSGACEVCLDCGTSGGCG